VPTESIDDRLRAAGLPTLPRPVWLEIDEAALANNVAVFRELIGLNVELSAVVKADAYGHGLVPVGRAFESAGVDRLCVASLDEGLALRTAGIESDILVLFSIPVDGLQDAASNGIQISLTDPDSLLTALERPATSADDLVVTEVEVETGLSRGGVMADDLPEVLRRARTSKHALGPIGVWTHVAAPEDEAATTAQVEKFERAVQLAQAAGDMSGLKRHMAATGGVLSGRVPVYEGVRIGLGLYGLLPLDLPMSTDGAAAAARLQPAMALKCRPLRIESFPAGTKVSYGGRWTAERESLIATLPVGYADTIPRSAPWGSALVRGQGVPLVGAVAMDAVMADVTEIPGVNLQDEFVLLGEQGSATISAEALARGRNTIPWEVATSMSHRLPRVYHAASVLKGLRTLNAETRVSTTEREKGELTG
jgi:alanine racemase